MSTYASIPIRSAAVMIENPLDPAAIAAKLPKLVLGPDLQRWLSGLSAIAQAAPQRQASLTSLVNQSASLAVTPLPIATVQAGLWAVYYEVRVTTVAGVTSSIQVIPTWTERGTTQTDPGAVLAGNLITTREGRLVVFFSDAANPISLSTVYASNPANAMKYSLDIVPVLIAPVP